MNPSKRQKILLDYISNFINTNGYSPSYREIQDALGYTSIATVHLHIHSLIDKGFLRNKFNYGRTLEVVGTEEILLEKRIAEGYKKANKIDKQIILRALDLLGFGDLTDRLK